MVQVAATVPEVSIEPGLFVDSDHCRSPRCNFNRAPACGIFSHRSLVCFPAPFHLPQLQGKDIPQPGRWLSWQDCCIAFGPVDWRSSPRDLSGFQTLIQIRS
jgi:hypothetical protein